MFEGYATWADVMAEVPTQTFATGSVGSSRLGRADGHLFVAPWSGSELGLRDPLTTDLLGSVVLEDFDTWITGISAVGDRWFVADDGRGDAAGQGSWEVRIAEFTPDGAAVQSHWIGPSEFVAGLSCRANAGP